MKELHEFLTKQTILQIAPAAGDPWIANVLFVFKEPNRIYFFGNTERLYSSQLLSDPHLAFATAWHADGNHLDRKGIQGVGRAYTVDDPEELAEATALHNHFFVEFTGAVNPEAIADDSNPSCMWRIDIDFIKFWNDELYGPNGSKEFSFERQV